MAYSKNASAAKYLLLTLAAGAIASPLVLYLAQAVLGAWQEFPLICAILTFLAVVIFIDYRWKKMVNEMPLNQAKRACADLFDAVELMGDKKCAFSNEHWELVVRQRASSNKKQDTESA